jgi:hypothetical protein
MKVLSNLDLVTQSSRITSIVDAPTIPTDAVFGTIFKVTLAGNRTLANPTNSVDGQIFTWLISQDSTGGRLLTFGNKFVNTSSVKLETSPNAVNVIQAIYTSTDDKFIITNFNPIFSSTSSDTKPYSWFLS